MSMFGIDTEIPYDRYLRWIYDHGTRIQMQNKDPAYLMRVAEALLSASDTCMANSQPAMAYYYAVRSLQFLDDNKTGVNLRRKYPQVNKLIDKALSHVSTLEKGALHESYSNAMKKLRSAEPDRLRVINKQLMIDNGANSEIAASLINAPTTGGLASGESAVADRKAEHERRKQQLLAQEVLRNSQFASELNLAQPSAPSTAPSSSPSLALSSSSPLSVAGSTASLPSSRLAMAAEANSHGPSYMHYSVGAPNGDNSEFAPATNPVADSAQQALILPRPGPPSMVTPSRYESLRLNLPGVRRAGTNRRGIVNLGNTCYMNSVLQMLNATPLGDHFAHGHYRTRANSPVINRSNLPDYFYRVLADLREPNAPYAVSPSSFKHCVAEANDQFNNSSQQDANEFLRTLLDSLHSALNECAGSRGNKRSIDNTHGSDDAIATEYWQQYIAENSSIVVDMCAFQERSSIQCPACHQCSRSFAPAFGIELPIAKADRISIEECFSLYCRREVLEDSSLYSCPECHGKVRAVKQMLFYTLPDILFVTLKRFRVFGDFSNTQKNNEHVYFGAQLDLSPFMCTRASNTLYHLVGIVNHQGNIHGGHYTSDCQGGDGVWCHFSDETVSLSDSTQNSLVYILCYKRIRN